MRRRSMEPYSAASLTELPDSALVGPMGPLFLLLRPYSDPGIKDLRQELEKLYDSVKHVYMEEDPSHTASWWMKEVRDVCHEIADYYDESVPLQIPWDFAGFVARVQDMSQRATSIHLGDSFKQVAAPDVTLHLPVPDAPIEDLAELLAFGDEKQLRVVILFGFAAAVNTKAARTLYDLYGGSFQCRAFVRVSKDPDMRSIFTSILSQIKAPPGEDHGFSDVNNLIRSINKHLQQKRYLIVIDDLWTSPERNLIMGAFPGGYSHSRIITTTQTKDVALASHGNYLQNIFEMTPLNDDQSGPDRMKEELNRIYNKLTPELKTCLLYLNMYQSGYTVTKDDLVRQWIAERFVPTRSFGGQENLAGDYFDELVRRDLIQPLERNVKASRELNQPEEKNCSDEVISCTVEHMVLDMIAQKCKEIGFITTVDNYMEKTGPPIEPHRLSIQFKDEVNPKIPQNIVLTKVRSLAFSGFYGCIPSLVQCRLLQVLILHIWADRGNGTFDLSGISDLHLLRYVKIRCNVTVNLPNKIRELKALQTLEVDARTVVVPSDVTGLPCLLHVSLPSANLPTDVSAMASLCTLGCFDLSRDLEDVEKLFNLRYLEDLHLTCSAPHEGNMQEKMDVIWGLIFSQNGLRSVDLLPTEGSNHADGPAFLNTLEGAADSSPSWSEFHRLELSPRICIFSSIPERFAELGNLRILKIAVREISEKDIRVLTRIPALVALSLYVWARFHANKVKPPAERSNQKNGPPRIEFGKYWQGFPFLRYFKFTCPAPCLAFLEEAMPEVRRLKLRFNASSMREYRLQFAGLEHLTGLREVSVKMGNDGAYESHRLEAKSALESAFQNHPTQPIVNMQSVDRIFGADQPQGADSSSSSLLSESSSYHENPGVEKSCRRTDDVHQMKARRLLLHIVGHNNYKFIQQQKEQMIIVIDGNKEDNQPAPRPREKWIFQLQELVYDIEDFIYNLCRLTTMLSLTDIVARMKHLKSRIKTLRNWQHAAQWSQSGDSTVAAATTFAPLGYQTHPYCCTREYNTIGIDKPKRELLRLMDMRSPKDTQLMVISIVGCRGLGKSTLARAVYDNLRSDFDRIAWVVASDCNNSGDLLRKIHQQLGPANVASSTTCKEYELNYALSNQRYLLVIDQVQRAELWHGMADALPQCNSGNRIIVTTSIQSVAATAATTTSRSSIYMMQSLGDDDSKSLFWKTFYGRDTEPAPALADDSESILKKCDGLPLSLISMARYFRQHYRTGTIERFGRFVGGAPEALGEMDNALAQCYSSLRDNGHRVCLLSLGLFPHGHPINRKSLIRKWVAEGLVAGDGICNREEVAASRFDELIDRNIIEPVLIGNNSSVKRCRVHGLMLEFIINKAISRNFITLIRKDETVPNKQDHLVRRLSVQDGTAEGARVATEIGLSFVRSLTSFKSVILDFQSCKLLRILDLEGCTGISDAVLDSVCQLLILKYLSLRGSDVHRIPKRIIRLQYLETLDLRQTDVKELPIEVIRLPWLAHLFGKFDLPGELKDGKKNSKLHKFLSEKSRLQTLSGFVMDRNSGSESIIINARCLRKVKIWCKKYSAFPSEDILVSSINRRFSGSSALESLSIEIDTYGSPGFLHSLEAPCMLSSMKLSGQIGKLPGFITSSATTLRELQLSSTGLSTKELSLLQELPCLLYLKLYEDRWGFGIGNFLIDSNGFQSLERLCFQAPTIPQIDIKKGAKTKLSSLYLLCPEYPPSRIKGIEYLQHLSEVVLQDSLEASELEVWRETAMKHENRPRVTKQAASSKHQQAGW